MYSIFAEKYGYKCDDNYHYYVVKLDENGKVLDKTLLPEHVEEIYDLVSDSAIIKWHLEGQRNVQFRADDECQIRTEHSRFTPYGVEIQIGNCKRYLEKGYEEVEVLIGMVKDVESILEYDEELKRA